MPVKVFHLMAEVPTKKLGDAIAALNDLGILAHATPVKAAKITNGQLEGTNPVKAGSGPVQMAALIRQRNYNVVPTDLLKSLIDEVGYNPASSSYFVRKLIELKVIGPFSDKEKAYPVKPPKS